MYDNENNWWLKSETEGLILAVYKHNKKPRSNPICRLCEQETESIEHLLCSY